MSLTNEITAFFKGGTGVAESVYQYDYGRILVLEGIELPATFDVYFSHAGDEEATPAVGSDLRVAIPNSIISLPGIVTAYIPLHATQSDSEVEYVARFMVIGRAKPVDDGTTEEHNAIAAAIAALQNYTTNIRNVLAEVLPDEVASQLADLEEDITSQLSVIEDEMLAYVREIATVVVGAVAGHYTINSKDSASSFTVASSKMSVNINGYTYSAADRIDLYINGIKLDGSEYSHSNNSGKIQFTLANYSTNADITALLNTNTLEVEVLKVGE